MLTDVTKVVARPFVEATDGVKAKGTGKVYDAVPSAALQRITTFLYDDPWNGCINSVVPDVELLTIVAPPPAILTALSAVISPNDVKSPNV